jgi:perosamine synthetase
VGEGDEVITSPFSFVASANVALYERARPVFVDIDQVTLCLDPDAAAAAVTERTRAVLPVHIFGYPAALEVLERLGLPIVEDACEALGAVDASGVPVGGRGHPAVFGFYANKQLTTGEGGMVTLEDAALKERLDSERNQGRAPDMGWLDHDRLGFNYRLSEVACALGLAQLERLDEMIGRRRALRARYAELFETVPGARVFQRSGDSEDNCWLSAVLVEPAEAGWTAEDLRVALDEADIESRPLWKPMHLQPVFADSRSWLTGAADHLFATGLTLPSGSALRPDQVETVLGTIGGFLGRRR